MLLYFRTDWYTRFCIIQMGNFKTPSEAHTGKDIILLVFLTVRKNYYLPGKKLLLNTWPTCFCLKPGRLRLRIGFVIGWFRAPCR